MTTPDKYKDARLNPEYVDYLERTLDKVRQALYALEGKDDGSVHVLWDCLTSILKALS